MNRTFKAAVAAFNLAVCFAGAVAAGPFEDATAAYTKGDYATALRLIRPLAARGDANAQRLLGDMYANELGVPKDMDPEVRLSAAATLYRKAAEQGDAAAKFDLADIQDRLGIIYDVGVGVPKNPAEAAVWYRYGSRAWQRRGSGRAWKPLPQRPGCPAGLCHRPHVARLGGTERGPGSGASS